MIIRNYLPARNIFSQYRNRNLLEAHLLRHMIENNIKKLNPQRRGGDAEKYYRFLDSFQICYSKVYIFLEV